ncbi:hypothetical protein BDW02DRAFT_419354 [Decorospora gaudefroyi]|uniref:Uncharacterized protein n=1 Tax=Decorospora gaudefroyi TaxID=184978 RepID=A0A6A5KBQ2_9PLEO|nr:hypothetical protein BDW02DRAFT_419354 [Decorospora gaudefroyi]
MPPPPISSYPARVESWTTLPSQHLLRAILLLSLLATAVRSIFVLVAQRKKRMSRSVLSREDSFMDGERPPKERKDSSQDGEVHLPTYTATKPEQEPEKKVNTTEEENNTPPPPSPDKQPNQYLQSLEQETIHPSLLPIYPWLSPPQPLPGPYDTPYYPLPLPSIQPAKPINQEPTANDDPEELESICYTRRLSTTQHSPLLSASLTISTKGWRRTQWSVTAG